MVVLIGVFFCLFVLYLLQFLKFVAYSGWPDGCESKENWLFNLFSKKIAKLESYILESPTGKKNRND